MRLHEDRKKNFKEKLNKKEVDLLLGYKNILTQRKKGEKNV